MNPEVKALKQVVEHFGNMISKLQRDHIKFSDWLDRVMETDNFQSAAEKTEVNEVEVKHTAMKIAKNKSPEEIKQNLDKLKELGFDLDESSDDEFNPDSFL